MKQKAGGEKTLESDIVVVGAAAAVNGTVVTQGSKIQKELGVTDDSPAIKTEDYIKNGHNLNDRRMLKLYVNNVGQTIDWATFYAGMTLNKEGGFTNEAEHSKLRVMRWIDGAQGANRSLHAAVAKSGTQVLLSPPAQKLIVEENKVVGVGALGSDGTQYTIRSVAVILATGGFGANKDMLVGLLKTALYYGVKSSNGDGHRMAMDADDATQNMHLGKIYPNGMEASPSR